MGQTNDKAGQSGRKPARVQRAERFDASRFVQYELDEAERAACKGWDLDGDALWLEVSALVDDGYSVSVKWDSFSDSYACFVQIRGDDQHPNAGLILTGRGSTAGKACKQAAFKHKALGANWLPFAERRKQVIDD